MNKRTGPLLYLLLLLSISCTSVYETVFPTLVDGKYDSEFPYRNSSQQLEAIAGTIKLINCIAFYTSYILDDNTKLTLKEVKKIDIESRAIEEVYFNRTASGTATLIHQEQGYVALLTVAHVVNFPDTLYSYFINADGSFSPYVQSISIKTRQSNYIPDLPDGGELEILAINKLEDIAILGRRFQQSTVLHLQVFDYPWGKSNDLEWGSFVYVFGFPMNYKMISKAIVSKQSKEKNSFLIDAVFNRGHSGGIVLAIRDGVPNFELVGLVKSVPADYQYNLHPITRQHDFDYNPLIPYKGEVYVEKEQIIRMGITKVIGIESVIEFLRKNENLLRSKGYNFSKYTRQAD